MSFSKALDLLKLAKMVAGRSAGVSLAEIAEEFSCSHRTAQRMTQALELTFPGVETKTDDLQRKRWRLDHYDVRLLVAEGFQDTEFVALEMSIRRASREGATNEVDALQRIRDRLLAAVSRPTRRRVESDAEAILEAQGYACRPGPKFAVNERLLLTITSALRGPFLVSMTYESDLPSAGTTRLVEPYGLMLGTRKYLVGKIHGYNSKIRHFRLDRIGSIQLTKQSFHRCSEFNLESYAARAFGSYHSDDEYEEVVWRFRPDAAKVARDFLFHPTQELIQENDGSLLVKFKASGHLEMAWHLYCWGDAVEVLKPEKLCQLVRRHQRSDFESLP